MKGWTVRTGAAWLTCGLCGGSQRITPEADLRKWRRSKRHGAVHTWCFRRMREKIRRRRETIGA